MSGAVAVSMWWRPNKLAIFIAASCPTCAGLCPQVSGGPRIPLSPRKSGNKLAIDVLDVRPAQGPPFYMSPEVLPRLGRPLRFLEIRIGDEFIGWTSPNAPPLLPEVKEQLKLMPTPVEDGSARYYLAREFTAAVQASNQLNDEARQLREKGDQRAAELVALRAQEVARQGDELLHGCHMGSGDEEFLQVALDLRADFPMEDIMHRLNRPYRLKFRADALSPQNFRAEEIVLGVILGVVLDVVLRVAVPAPWHDCTLWC